MNIYFMENKSRAIITWATSWIWKWFAYKLAYMWYNILLIWRNKNRLNLNSKEIEELYNVKTRIVIADFSISQDLEKLIKSINELDKIDYLVNNAWFWAPQDFLSEKWDTRENMINTHIIATSKLSYYVCKKMKKYNSGNIINVSSLAIFFPTLYGFMYHSTKSFVKSFSQNLFIYLKDTNIKVQCLCPWFTQTDFFSRDNTSIKQKPNKNLFQTVNDVVDSSLKNIKKGSYLHIPWFKNKVFYFLSNIIPLKLVNAFIYLNKKKQ